MEERQSSNLQRRRLAVLLSVVFVLAVVMGAGPGIYLINPDPDAAGPTPKLLGMPIIYTWTVLWTFAQGAVVLIAYFCLWNTADAGGQSRSSGEGEEPKERSPSE